MAKIKKYVCTNCGYSIGYELGKCPECKSFNTMKLAQEDIINKANRNEKFSTAKTFDEIPDKNDFRFATGIKEFDRVYGGGIVSDSVNTLAAVAGSGKTTLLLEVCYAVATKHNFNVLYASAEESERQLKITLKRLFKNKKIPDTFKAISTKYIENVIEEAIKYDARLIVIDSNKTFLSLDSMVAGTRAGSPSQMMACTDKIIELCKHASTPRAAYIISQFTKDEKMAGPEEFKHAVDSCAYIDFDEGEEIRNLRTEKNRFHEIENGIFIMTDEGLLSVDNPSEYFTTYREKNDEVPGVALTVIKEGTRAIVAEIESLVTKTYLPYGTRIATCLRKDNINILLSIITEIMDIDMNGYNVIINTTGGLKLSSKSSDLAIIMSILSVTFKEKKIISNGDIFVAEVGLTGELKKIQGLERRIKELERMGYKRVFVAKNNIKNINDFKNIQIVECKNIKDVWAKI